MSKFRLQSIGWVVLGRGVEEEGLRSGCVNVIELAGSCGFEFDTHVIWGRVFNGGREGLSAIPRVVDADEGRGAAFVVWCYRGIHLVTGGSKRRGEGRLG